MAIKQMTKGRVIGMVAQKKPKPEPENPVAKAEPEQRTVKRKQERT